MNAVIPDNVRNQLERAINIGDDPVGQSRPILLQNLREPYSGGLVREAAGLIVARRKADLDLGRNEGYWRNYDQGVLARLNGE